MKKKEILKWIAAIGTTTALICCPFIVYHFIMHSAEQDTVTAWYSFLGDYLGGIATLIGVAVTLYVSKKDTEKQLKVQAAENKKQLDVQKKEFREQLEADREKIKEDHRLLVSPYVVTDFQFIINDDVISDFNAHTIEIEDNKIKRILTGISGDDRKFIKNHSGNEVDDYVFIRYRIRNIGSGSAINMLTTILDEHFHFAIAAEDEINLYFFIHKGDLEPHDIFIHYDYWDQLHIGEYEFSEILRYQFDENSSSTGFTNKEWQHPSIAGKQIHE